MPRVARGVDKNTAILSKETERARRRFRRWRTAVRRRRSYVRGNRGRRNRRGWRRWKARRAFRRRWTRLRHRARLTDCRRWTRLRYRTRRTRLANCWWWTRRAIRRRTTRVTCALVVRLTRTARRVRRARRREDTASDRHPRSWATPLTGLTPTMRSCAHVPLARVTHVVDVLPHVVARVTPTVLTSVLTLKGDGCFCVHDFLLSEATPRDGEGSSQRTGRCWVNGVGTRTKSHTSPEVGKHVGSAPTLSTHRSFARGARARIIRLARTTPIWCCHIAREASTVSPTGLHLERDGCFGVHGTSLIVSHVQCIPATT